MLSLATALCPCRVWPIFVHVPQRDDLKPSPAKTVKVTPSGAKSTMSLAMMSPPRQKHPVSKGWERDSRIIPCHHAWRLVGNCALGYKVRRGWASRAALLASKKTGSHNKEKLAGHGAVDTSHLYA